MLSQSAGIILFLYLPCIFGLKPELTSSKDPSPSTCIGICLKTMCYFLHLLQLVDGTVNKIIPPPNGRFMVTDAIQPRTTFVIMSSYGLQDKCLLGPIRCCHCQHVFIVITYLSPQDLSHSNNRFHLRFGTSRSHPSSTAHLGLP